MFAQRRLAAQLRPAAVVLTQPFLIFLRLFGAVAFLLRKHQLLSLLFDFVLKVAKVAVGVLQRFQILEGRVLLFLVEELLHELVTPGR